MDLKEFKDDFHSDLKNGLDHAEWYEEEIKWLIHRIERMEKVQKVTDESYRVLLEKNKQLEKDNKRLNKLIGK